MKKRYFFCIFLVTLTFFKFYAHIAENLQEYTLENGLSVFLLPDNTNATVNIEFQVRAGFSSQTQNTMGFFTLYTNLLKATNPKLNFSEVQTNSDSSRYIIQTTPQELSNVLIQLSDCAFSLNTTDEILKEQLNLLKTQVTQNAQSLSGLINSAIDSKVFSDAPWKNDSGIYPPIFNSITEKNARTILKNIQDKWYTPQNSALFITGNINSEKTLSIIKQTFGSYYSTYNLPQEKPLKPVNNQRKFVIHHKELSPDITQVVVQYTLLDKTQADILSWTLNDNYSDLKNALTNTKELNILGNEYIDVSSAHKKDHSRLIFQSLLQPPEDKKNKINSCKQAEIFLNTIKNSPSFINENNYEQSKLSLMHQMNYIEESPKIFMENLSNFWGQMPFSQEASLEEISETFPNSITASAMFARKTVLEQSNFSQAINTFKTEEPFIFVIINSNEYKKNKNEYKKQGFQEITTENASWYVQKMYDEIKKTTMNQQEFNNIGYSLSTDNDYYKNNISQLKTHTLSNGILLITKQNTQSTGTSILLSIDGGKLKTYNNHGFEEVIINLIAQNIQRELSKKQLQGTILGNITVNSYSNLYTSYILIDCLGGAQNVNAILNAISNALIFSDIMPASADRAVSQRQYKKRLENGSNINQLYSKFINTIYPNSELVPIFETQSDILQSTTYQQILQTYPDYLNADLYTLVIVGDFYDSVLDSAEDSLGKMASYSTQKDIPKSKITELKSIDISNIKNKKIYTKINHTFLTDIPKEKAGPMPQVLIPTKEFLDPVIYVIEAPTYDNFANYALFCSLIQFLQKQIQQECTLNPRLTQAKVSVRLPQKNIPFASIIIQNVSHTKESDAIYTLALKKITNSLKAPYAETSILKDIQSTWIMEQLNPTDTNSGTAQLLQQGLELDPENKNFSIYLELYNAIQNASLQDYLDLIQTIPTTPALSIYSNDSKK